MWHLVATISVIFPRINWPHLCSLNSEIVHLPGEGVRWVRPPPTWIRAWLKLNLWHLSGARVTQCIVKAQRSNQWNMLYSFDSWGTDALFNLRIIFIAERTSKSKINGKILDIYRYALIRQWLCLSSRPLSVSSIDYHTLALQASIIIMSFKRATTLVNNSLQIDDREGDSGRRYLCSTSCCHRSAHADTIWPPSFFQSVAPPFGTVYLRHCVLLTIYSSAGI